MFFFSQFDEFLPIPFRLLSNFHKDLLPLLLTAVFCPLNQMQNLVPFLQLLLLDTLHLLFHIISLLLLLKVGNLPDIFLDSLPIKIIRRNNDQIVVDVIKTSQRIAPWFVIRCEDERVCALSVSFNQLFRSVLSPGPLDSYGCNDLLQRVSALEIHLQSLRVKGRSECQHFLEIDIFDVRHIRNIFLMVGPRRYARVYYVGLTIYNQIAKLDVSESIVDFERKAILGLVLDCDSFCRLGTRLGRTFGFI